MVVLITLLQATEDRDAVFLARLVDHDGLEAAFEGLVLLEVFLVLLQGRRANAAELAAGQGGFEDVGGVHGAFPFARSDKGMDFVDEEDDAALGARHFVHDAFQAFLKLPFVFRAGHEGAHVEGVEFLVPEVLGHVAAHDALGQPFDDGGLAGTRFADKDRVVLRAAAQDLQHAADFLIPADDGVEPSLARFLDEVAGILAERLIGLFARSRADFGAAAQLLDGRAQGLFGHAGVFEHRGGRALGKQQAEQQGFEADILVAVGAGRVGGALQGVARLAAEIGFAGATDARQALYLVVDGLPEQALVDSQLPEEEVRHILAHRHHTFEQMHGLDGLLAGCRSAVDGFAHGLLCFDSEVVKCHSVDCLTFCPLRCKRIAIWEKLTNWREIAPALSCRVGRRRRERDG